MLLPLGWWFFWQSQVPWTTDFLLPQQQGFLCFQINIRQYCLFTLAWLPPFHHQKVQYFSKGMVISGPQFHIWWFLTEVLCFMCCSRPADKGWQHLKLYASLKAGVLPLDSGRTVSLSMCPLPKCHQPSTSLIFTGSTGWPLLQTLLSVFRWDSGCRCPNIFLQCCWERNHMLFWWLDSSLELQESAERSISLLKPDGWTEAVERAWREKRKNWYEY